MSVKTEFDINAILSILPHRPPFLFVDRVIKLKPFKKIITERELRDDEPHFKGHFPGQPVVPGVIQLQIIKELMEQTLNQKLMLAQMSFAKYLQAILPGKTPIFDLVIDFKLKENDFSFMAILKNNKVVYSKVKGTFSKLSNYTKTQG